MLGIRRKEADSLRFPASSRGTHASGTRASVITTRGNYSSLWEPMWTRRLWNRNCHEDALRMTHAAMADDDVLTLKAAESMTAWSLDALMDIQPKFSECSRTTLESWTCVAYAGQLWRRYQHSLRLRWWSKQGQRHVVCGVH